MLSVPILVLLTLLIGQNGESANILYLAPVASPSHHIWNRHLALGLVAKGHNVTMFTHDREKVKPPTNYTEIVIEGVYEYLHENFDFEEITLHKPMIMVIFEYVHKVTSYDFNSPAMETLWNYPEDYTFDLVIYDASLGLALLPFVDRFGNPPLIFVTPFLLPTSLAAPLGHHVFPSYMPHYSTPFNDRMGFYNRVRNLIYHYSYHFYDTIISGPSLYKMAVERFGQDRVRPFQEHLDKVALLFANIDPVLDYAISLPPNIIPLGGLHARPGSPLPADLQKIMDEAEHGIILFSMGTNFKSTLLSEAVRNNIISNLARLKQVVLWKFEEHIEGLPANIITRKWLPQNDMMAHPNLKLFISHGGALSTQEAMYHGIPLVGIPFFSDQANNILKMQDRNLAVHVEMNELGTTDRLHESVSKVLNNNLYKDSMTRISRLMRSSPVSAQDRAIYWVEHVLKFGFVPEFRPPIREMYFHQIYYLDFIAVSLVVLFLVYKLCCATKKYFNVKVRNEKNKVKHL